LLENVLGYQIVKLCLNGTEHFKHVNNYYNTIVNFHSETSTAEIQSIKRSSLLVGKRTRLPDSLALSKWNKTL
jgi:hypothetical protein